MATSVASAPKVVRLRALRSFSGLEGRVRRGTVFTARAQRADYLTQHGLAIQLDAPASIPPVGPSQTQATGPTEIKPVGGGWYEFGGKRYRGRQAAEDARDD